MKKVRSFALASILMALCISCAQQAVSTENGVDGVYQGTKVGNPKMLGVTSKMDGKGSPIIPDSLLPQHGVIKLPDKLSEGETLADYMLKQPGVSKDEDDNIILVSGKKITSEDIDFIEKLQNNK